MSARKDRRAGAGLRYGLAFALVSALILLQPFCAMTLLKLFYTEGGELIQPRPQEGFPVPASLAWSPFALNLIHRLGPLPLGGVLLWHIGLACVLFYGLLRILNPTFRMTTGVDWDRTVLSKTYMHTQPVIKAFLIVVTAFLPAFALWHLIAAICGQRAWAIVPQMAMIGAAAWALLSKNGVAGDYESGNYENPAGHAALGSLIGRGAIAGALGGLTMLYAPTGAPDLLFTFYRSLGGIGESQWWRILGTSVAFLGATAAAWGGIVIALGTPGWNPAVRLRKISIPGVLLAGVLLIWNNWLPRHLAQRYDFEPKSRVPVNVRLAQRAGLPSTPPVSQQALLLTGNRAQPIRFTGESFLFAELGMFRVNASPESATKIEQFLKRRDYATALAHPAYTALIHARALQWDSDGILRGSLLNLRHGADNAYVKNALDKLYTSAATAEAIRAAEQLSDERFMTYPDRRSLLQMGDIFARLGRKDKAEELYRKASLPPSQIGARAEEETMFAEGRVVGRILWNGKPAPGLKIGVVPVQAPMRLRESRADDGSTSPYWLSWVSTSTRAGEQGEFAIEKLVAGRYFLLLEAPTTERIRRREVIARGAPSIIEVSFATKEANTGTIDVQFLQTSP